MNYLIDPFNPLNPDNLDLITTEQTVLHLPTDMAVVLVALCLFVTAVVITFLAKAR